MSSSLRLGALGVVFALLFAVLGLRLWTIQVTNTDEYEARAELNQIRFVNTPAPRGDVFDRNGVLLAGTRPSLAAVVDLALVEEEALEDLARRLGAFLDVPASEIAARLEGAAAGSQVVLAEDLTERQGLIIAENREDFPGVAIIPQPVREYPEGDLAAHVLGYIGKPSEEDLEREGVKGTDVVGKAGVERVYDDRLRGTEGTIKYRVDARRNVLSLLGEQPPAPGGNLILTIDAEVQRQLQASLEEGLAWSRSLEMQERRDALAGKSIPQRLQEALQLAIDAEAAAAAEQSEEGTDPAEENTDVEEPLVLDEGDVLGPVYPGLPVDEAGVCIPVERIDLDVGGMGMLSGSQPRSIELRTITGGADPTAVVFVAGQRFDVERGDRFATTLQVIEITEDAIVIYHTDKYCPVRAVGVVLDPNNGDVIAMASYPDFEPGVFVDGLSIDQWRELGSVNAFTNFAVQGLYAPASTMKSVAWMMAMEEGAYPYASPPEGSENDDDDEERPPLVPLQSNTDKYECSGEFVFELNDGTKQRLRDWRRIGHGPTDLHQALAVSCDLYFWGIAQRIWNERADETGFNNENLWQEWARAFGFDEPTGIDLPFEREGLIPDRTWFQEEQAAGSGRVRSEGTWFGGDLMNAIVGQGAVLSTPLQLANAYAAMVNGGTVWSPRVVSEIVGQDGRTIDEHPPTVLKTVPLDPNTTRLFRRDLQLVVNGENVADLERGGESGTAYKAFRDFGDNVELVGGKTGTGEVIKATEDAFEVDNAWFVGVAPVNDPQYVVAVVVERGGSGGGVAAPVARQVLQFLVNGADGVTPLRDAGARAD